MSADVETVELVADSASITIARRFVARTFAGRVPRDVIADLVLVTSELVTNAIEHGYGADGERGPVHVAAQVGSASATVSVRSPGDDRLADPDDWEIPTPEVRTGRGLGIVRRVSDHVEVVRQDDQVEISASRTW
ncbi:MAG TPA: ATP-binding protein [Ilumatobacter sp.]|nr:ATP-binding protein [Ilumatobacter sp.]